VLTTRDLVRLITLLFVLAAIGCGGHTSAPATANSGNRQASFCQTHSCIPNFYNGNGYVVQCADGMWSHSGGEPGACSYHGGETGG
jgi:hypothetical protein